MNEKSTERLKPEYDVVVIGAGNGGLAAALELAVKGAKPLLLEQHNLPGGFATSFVRGRFEFEASLHELCSVGSVTNKGGVRAFLEDEAKVEIDWVPVPEAYRLILTDEKMDVTMPFGVDAFIDAGGKAVPGSRDSVETYMRFCEGISDALGVIGKLQDKPDLTKIAATIQNLPAALKHIASTTPGIVNFLKTLPCTVEEVTRTFNIPDDALKIIYPYWCYLGVPMSRMAFSLWAALIIEYIRLGAYIPRMRSHELTSAMEMRIRELGGRIEFNTRVEKILVEKGRVTGLETSAGDKIKTSCVICNASPTLTYNRLIHPAEEVPEAAHRNVNAHIHGGAGFVVYLGLDAPPAELGINEYGYFISKTMDTDAVYNSLGRLGMTDMQATICLNNAVPDCSPPGTTILSMTTLYKPDVWAGVTAKDYFALKNKIAGEMIDEFEKALGTKIRGRIEEFEVATPATFSRYTGTYKGIIYGYEPEPWDSIITRHLALKDENYIRGLMFAGGFGAMCMGYSS
ncbi:MAG TPA: FAD-dependent oxidoreductase, partial [bacterium]|nr:FAD-dependent oxidoreductase [bacterium]